MSVESVLKPLGPLLPFHHHRCPLQPLILFRKFCHFGKHTSLGSPFYGYLSPNFTGPPILQLGPFLLWVRSERHTVRDNLRTPMSAFVLYVLRNGNTSSVTATSFPIIRFVIHFKYQIIYRLLFLLPLRQNFKISPFRRDSSTVNPIRNFFLFLVNIPIYQ